MTPERVTWWGIGVNATLGGVKVATGLAVGAQALVADGLHSISDLATDIAVLAGVRISSRPPDRRHPYGHRRVTTLVSALIGLMLLASAAWIVYAAIEGHDRPHVLDEAGLAALVAFLSIAPKEILFRVTRRVGLEARDSSLIANAWHHRTDAFTSVAATVGLAGVAIGGPGWGFLDQITAVVLAAFLGVAAVGVVRDSVTELVDEAPREAVMRSIEAAIAGTPGVRGFHALRVRRLGGGVTLDVHILVDPHLSVSEGHDLATRVRERLDACDCGLSEAVIHVEPDEDGSLPENGHP